MCTIEKLTVDEIALKLRLDYDSESGYCELTEADVYFTAIDYGFTQCDCCEMFVSYDDYCGTYGMCDDCAELNKIAG